MFISKNSFLVLWLESDANDNILNKRYKELLNFLSIDEVGFYKKDFDFIDYTDIRTEENIKEAFHKLSNQNKKIYQTFFWFQIIDDQDEDCLNKIIEWNYIKWSNQWLKLFKATEKYHYLKNHIIVELLLYENQKKFKEYDFSDTHTNIIKYLYKLINADSFWKEFKHIFDIQNEISLREDVLDDFRDWMSQLIAEDLFDLSEDLWKPKLYKEFNNIFGISAKELDDNKNVTEVIKEIETMLKKVQSMDLSEDLDEVIDWVNAITLELKKLTNLWLENNHKIIKLKDGFATHMRDMSIKLFNEHDDTDSAIEFIQEAIKVAHSQSLKEKFRKDKKDIHWEWEKIWKFTSLLEVYKKWVEKFKEGNYKSAEKFFSSCIDLIISDLLDEVWLETEKMELLKNKIQDSLAFGALSWGEALKSAIGNIDTMVKMLDDDWWFSWGDNINFFEISWYKAMVLTVFINSISHKKIANIISNKSSHYWSQWDWWDWWDWRGVTLFKRLIYIIIGIIFVLIQSS